MEKMLEYRMWKSGFKIGKYYATPDEDCSKCSFCMEIEPDLHVICISEERFELNDRIKLLTK